MVTPCVSAASSRLRATRPFETDEPVACGIPGYDEPGTELIADELAVDDDPFASELEGNCAFHEPLRLLVVGAGSTSGEAGPAGGETSASTRPSGA